MASIMDFVAIMLDSPGDWIGLGIFSSTSMHWYRHSYRPHVLAIWKNRNLIQLLADPRSFSFQSIISFELTYGDPFEAGDS